MANVDGILKEHLEVIKNRIIQKMEASGRNATGKSVSSLKVEVKDGHGIIWGSKSFLAMERGRGPGPIPKGFTEIIMRWAKAKGISISSNRTQNKSQDSMLRSFAGAVAFTIMKKGTRLYRNKAYNDIYTSVLSEELEKMADSMSVNLLEEITKINQDAL